MPGDLRRSAARLTFALRWGAGSVRLSLLVLGEGLTCGRIARIEAIALAHRQILGSCSPGAYWFQACADSCPTSEQSAA